MPAAHEGTDIISYFHEGETYHTATPYIISRKRYIIEKHKLLCYTGTKEGINVLSRILGKNFNCISRAIDMLCLFLGEDFSFADTHGHQVNVAEFSFHFQTQWRFREDKDILLASRDIYEPYSENVPADWEYDLVGRSDEMSSVFDVQAKALSTKMQGATVADYHISAVNDLVIIFSNGIVFEQFTPASQKDEEWRLIDYKNDVHLVCCGCKDGISQE